MQSVKVPGRALTGQHLELKQLTDSRRVHIHIYILTRAGMQKLLTLEKWNNGKMFNNFCHSVKQ